MSVMVIGSFLIKSVTHEHDKGERLTLLPNGWQYWRWGGLGFCLKAEKPKPACPGGSGQGNMIACTLPQVQVSLPKGPVRILLGGSLT
jgi:hypothetical protein